MICLSHLLKSTDKYISAADRVFAALDLSNIKYKLEIHNFTGVYRTS